MLRTFDPAAVAELLKCIGHAGALLFQSHSTGVQYMLTLTGDYDTALWSVCPDRDVRYVDASEIPSDLVFKYVV